MDPQNGQLAQDVQKQILVVDDDQEISSLLSQYLTQYQYIVHTAMDGMEMNEKLKTTDIDLILLDIMLPGEDGLTLCRKLRETSNTPIILLTAVKEDVDRIMGLEFGADDYQTKPFNPRELMARIRAVLRRSENRTTTMESKSANNSDKPVESKPGYALFHFSGWSLDTATRNLKAPDNLEVECSAGEYDLLLTFLEHPQRVLSRDQLLDQTRNRYAEPFDRSIDVLVSRIRSKIEENPKNPKIIKTIRNGGYMLSVDVKRL